MIGAATAPMANTANFGFDSGGAISSAVPTSSMSSRKLEKNSCVHDMTKRRITAEKEEGASKEKRRPCETTFRTPGACSAALSPERGARPLLPCALTAGEIAVVSFARAEVVERETEEAEEGVEQAARIHQQEHQHLREGTSRKQTAATAAVLASERVESEHDRLAHGGMHRLITIAHHSDQGKNWTPRTGTKHRMKHQRDERKKSAEYTRCPPPHGRALYKFDACANVQRTDGHPQQAHDGLARGVHLDECHPQRKERALAAVGVRHGGTGWWPPTMSRKRAGIGQKRQVERMGGWRGVVSGGRLDCETVKKGGASAAMSEQESMPERFNRLADPARCAS